MKIYTGYYAKLKEYKEANLFPIAVSAKVPKGIKILQWEFFAPTWKIWKNWHDNMILESTFRSLYDEEVLPCVNMDYVKFVLNELEESKKYEGVILLCYETPEKFCHRQLVAEFLNERLNIKVEEFKFSENDT